MAATESRSSELQAVAIGAWVLALVATVLRVYARAGIMKAFSTDDWLMMAAMFAFTINTTTYVLGTTFGSGSHMADLSPDQIENALMWWFACYPSIAVTLITAKLSVGFYLLRITTQKVHRWIIYAALATSTIAGITFFFVTLLQCQPIPYAWRKITGSGTCTPIDTVINIMFTYSAFTLFADGIFTLLPAWLVFHLQMNLKKKVALVLILGMACIASSAVIVRFPHINDFRDPDILWATATFSVWTQIEAGLAISAGSFATLRPLYRILLIKLRLTTDNTTPSYGRRGNTGGDYIINQKNGTASGGGNAGNSTKFTKSRHSTAPGRNMFSMATFNRIDDDDDNLVTEDDDSAHGRRGTPSLVGSTADLHGKKSNAVVVVGGGDNKKDDCAGDYSVQIIAQKGTYDDNFDEEAGRHRHHHKRDPSDRISGLQIRYTKEFGSDA